MKANILNHTGIRTFELIQHITGPLEGEIDDWPANIQDKIHEALEHAADEYELKLAIVMSRCAIDEDAEAEGRPQEKFFIHVIASEVVIADERTIDPRRLQ